MKSYCGPHHPRDRAKARRIFAATGRKGLLSLELNDLKYVSQTWHIEWLSASLGDKEKALEYLNRAFQERGIGAFLLPFINVDPLYDFLRDDPRFEEIVQRMGL